MDAVLVLASKIAVMQSIPAYENTFKVKLVLISHLMLQDTQHSYTVMTNQLNNYIKYHR